MVNFTQRLGLTRYEADEYYKKALEAYGKLKLEEAILNMDEAIKALPNNSEYYAARGLFYLEDGVTEKAQADFEYAVKLHRYELLACYGRGIIAFKQGNWDEALAHFTDAYGADPNRPETLYYLALTQHRKGNHAAALPLMEKAQTALETAGDKRRVDATKWVKELQRLIAQAQKPLTPMKPATSAGQLPMSLDDE